jgi:hypothetical protein
MVNVRHLERKALHGSERHCAENLVRPHFRKPFKNTASV